MAGGGRAGRDRSATKKRLAALGWHLLAEGPLPPEGILSVLCESFGCTPEVAEELDPVKAFAVLEYRLGASARDQLNRKATDMSSGQANFLLEVGQALEADGVDVQSLIRHMRAEAAKRERD